MATFKVTVIHKGAGSTKEYIEAVNVPEARRFAEARFPAARLLESTALTGKTMSRILINWLKHKEAQKLRVRKQYVQGRMAAD